MAQLSNIRTVSVPSIGKLSLSEKPGTFTPSGVKREHKSGRLAEDGGWVETSTAAKLEVNVNLMSGLDLTALGAVGGEDITVRMADGTVHMMKGAFAQEPPPTGEDGTTKVTFLANTSEVI